MWDSQKVSREIMPRGKRLDDETVEKLVEIVRGLPYIYDASDGDHMDAQKISNTWASIAEKMNISTIEGKFTYHQLLKYPFFSTKLLKYPFFQQNVYVSD